MFEDSFKIPVDLLRYFSSFSFQFRYFNAMLINENRTGPVGPEGAEDPEDELRKEFHLEMDEHFNNIYVNTTVSTVQVATNVYNLCKFAALMNTPYYLTSL